MCFFLSLQLIDDLSNQNCKFVYILSHHAFESDIKPGNKIDKPLVVYDIVMLHYDVHYNIA